MSNEYKILKIDQLSRGSRAGGIEKFYRIQYQTKGGVVDTTDVSEADYTEEKVATLLSGLAVKHDKILKL
ncbi:hypothetical protein ES703_47745 [subsurface metagenome]